MSPPSTVTVVLCHCSKFPGARWCEPVGWEPANELYGTEYADGAWWADGDEEAGLLCFVEGKEGQELQVSPGDLRVALSRDCQVIGPVIVGLASTKNVETENADTL
jgi:hypothetical protein